MWTVVVLLLGAALSSRVEFGVVREESRPKAEAVPFDVLEVMAAQGPFTEAFQSSLTNIQNLQYYGVLLVGTGKQEMTFIFDTGSNELWLPSVNCQDCAGGYRRYDPSSSDLFKRKSSDPDEIQYGKGHVWGYKCQDQIWFTANEKVDDFPILLVFKEQDFGGTQADGILGLAPMESDPHAPFTLDILKKHGIINELTLSFKYRPVGEESTMGFGEINPQLIEGTTKIEMPIIYKGILYFVNLAKSYYGPTQLSFDDAPALIDTGTSLIAAPLQPFITLLRYLKEKTGHLYTCLGGSLYCVPCAGIDKDEELTFDFGQGKVGIKYSDIFMDFGDICGLMMSPIQSNIWILGDVFIRNFYVVFKYEESKVELYPNAGVTGTATAAANVEVVTPPEEPASGKSLGWVFVGAAAAVAVGSLAAWASQKCSGASKTEEENLLLGYSL